MLAAVDPLLTSVGLLVAGGLVSAGFAWLTGRRSVALNELDTALEFFKGEAEEARKLRTENRLLDERIDKLTEELTTVRSALAHVEREKNDLKDRVDVLESQRGGDGVA